VTYFAYCSIFNHFSEVESFAAILIAHGTRVIFWEEGTHEAQRAENRGRIKADSGEWFGGGGSEPPPRQLGGLGL